MAETLPIANSPGPSAGETSRTARYADDATPPPGESVLLGLVAPGGGGSAEVLSGIARRLEQRGQPPLRMTGRRLEQEYTLGGLDSVIDLNDLADTDTTSPGSAPERRARDSLLERLDHTDQGVLLVDDAQWLDEASLRVLVGVTERAGDRGLSVVVAHRPHSGHPQLAALDAALGRDRPLLWLDPLDEQEVGERAALTLGAAVDPALVETLHEQTAGLAELVDRLVRAWDGTPRQASGLASQPGAEPPPPPPAVVEYIRTEVDQLPTATRTLLAALSFGADLNDDLLTSVTGLSRDELTAAFDALRSAGLLASPTDEVVPVVASTVVELTPQADRRRFNAALAEALQQGGAPPTRSAEHLVAAGANSKEAAQSYIAAGEACLLEAPELARSWFDRATSAGASPHELAARHAEALAWDGELSAALKLADSALNEPATPDRPRALGVVAALLPARGLWNRSASAYQELRNPSSPDVALLGAIGSVVAGSVDGERTLPEVTTAQASLELDALVLAAKGIIGTLDNDADQAELPFLEAAELLESAHNRVLLPDSPHALGATVALALCELNAAEHLLTRALEHDIGGRSLRMRHRLLLGWVAVRSGRWSAAEKVLSDAKGETLAPREQLLLAAIDAGLARRAGDLARLSEAWRQAESALLPYSVDLLSLDVLGELAIAASRLGCWDQISHKARELGNVLRTLGQPPLWVLPLRWTGLQVALASDDHEAVARRASEVAAVPPVHPRLQALADAAAQWVDVMAGEVAPAAVSAAAKGLQELSLTWEASRLTGQAAIRCGDPSMTRSLLEQARDLKAALPSGEPDQTPAAASVLSDREQAVAQHIVDGLTYKEIGAQLYISPKTVEHHVAKIRQKLGASTRAEMLAALRNQPI